MNFSSFNRERNKVKMQDQLKKLLLDFLRWPNIRLLLIFFLIYVLLSFVTSALGFLSPEPPVALREHVATRFFLELGGHFAFGFVAALPFLDFDIMILTGVFAVAIDTDHIFDSLGFYVSGRPDHSLFFGVLSGLILYYVARKMQLGTRREIKFAFIGPVVLFSHIAFDILAAYLLFIGKGYFFPLLAPFNFTTIPFSLDYWIPFEIAAFALALFGTYLARKIANVSKSGEPPKIIHSTTIRRP
jgi:hypothetical protein